MDEWWAWAVCLGSFVLQCLAFGLHNNFGVFFNVLLEKHGKSNAVTAWVGSFAFSVTFIFSPISGVIIKRFGYRTSVLISITCCVTALLASSFVDEIYVLYFTYSLLWGIGTSLANLASLVSLPHFFDRHLALATGISTSGSGVSSFVLGPFLNYLIQKYGFRWTLRISASMPLACVLALICYSMSTKKQKQLSTSLTNESISSTRTDSSTSTQAEDTCCSPFKACPSKNVKHHKLSECAISQGDESLILSKGEREVQPPEKILPTNTDDLDIDSIFMETGERLMSDDPKDAVRSNLIPNLKNREFCMEPEGLGSLQRKSYICVSYHDITRSFEDTSGTPEPSHNKKSIWEDIFDKSLLSNGRYILYAFGMATFLFGYFIPFVFLNKVAISRGISSTKASLLIGYLSIASTIGKVVLGFVINFQRILRRTTMFIMCMVIMAVSHLIIPMTSSYMALVAYAILFGLFDGCYVGQISTILGDLMQDKSKIGVALGNLYALFSIPVMSGPIIAGAIYDSSQSFDIPFYAAMGVSLLGAFITSFIRMFDKSSVDQVEGDTDETLITLTKPNMEKRELLFPGDSHKMMEIIDSKLTVV